MQTKSAPLTKEQIKENLRSQGKTWRNSQKKMALMFMTFIE